MKRKGPFALPPNRYPIPDLKHANLAITRLYMKAVTKAEARQVITAIRKRFKNEKLKDRIRALELKKGLKMAKKKRKKSKRKTTKKGNRRKGQPRGARLAYDDLKKKKKKKKKRKKTKKTSKGLMHMLTDALA